MKEEEYYKDKEQIQDYRSQFLNNGWVLIKNYYDKTNATDVLNWFNELNNKQELLDFCEVQYENKEEPKSSEIKKLRRLLWSDTKFWDGFLERNGIFELARQFSDFTPSLIYHAAFFKSKGIGSMVPFHQDQWLWNYQYPGAFNMWIPLEATDKDNGCIAIIDKSTHMNLVNHYPAGEFDHDYIKQEDYPLNELKYIEMEVGDILLWDRYTIHGSFPNRSDKNRKAFVMVFANSQTENFKSKDIHNF